MKRLDPLIWGICLGLALGVILKAFINSVRFL